MKFLKFKGCSEIQYILEFCEKPENVWNCEHSSTCCIYVHV